MAEPARFEVLDISLVRGADSGRVGAREVLWLSADSSQGSVRAIPVPVPDLPAALKPAIPGAGPPDAASKRPLDWLDRSIREQQPERETGLRLGRELSRTALGTAVVRELFDRARGVAAADGRPLLLRLLGAPNDVAEWPWELMTDPMDQDLPIALSRDLHLIRTPRVRTYPIRTAPIAPPLNLLVVLSSPLAGVDDRERIEPFDLYEAKRHLLAELRPLIAAGLLQVEVEDRPTIASLRERIGRRPRGFHAVHYLGHASQQGLALETRSGRTCLVHSARFSAILQHNPDLRLVVFSGCRTAQAPADDTDSSGDWEGGLSITHHVVRDAAPAVIGMQAVLPFDTERMFTRSFYSALTAGQSIAQSLKLARAALWDGPEGGSKLLDWAIPTLFCGGADPGPILDPATRAEPAQLPRRVSLRISPVQKELRFVSRYAELREAVDTLSGRSTTRLLCIRGINGILPEDLSSFIDRAMEELDPSIAQLSFSARDLAAGTDRGAADERIIRFIREVMRQYGIANEGRAADDLDWPVMLEQLSDVQMAIGIDHTDDLPADSPVFERIRSIVRRRSKVRVVIVNCQESNRFNEGLSDTLSLTLPLRPLTWPEVWQWITGQLPRLAQHGEERLAPLYQELTDRLEKWERLSGYEQSATHGLNEAQLAQAAVRLRDGVPSKAVRKAQIFSAGLERMADDRAEGREAAAPATPAHAAYSPVRIAVAGPHTSGRDAQIVQSMGRFASRYGIAGRVAEEAGAETAAITAQSLPSGSPFNEHGQSTTSDLIKWALDVTKAGAAILVCDFGETQQSAMLGDALKATIDGGSLVVAAGGNSGLPTWPAWFPFVLAVGALDEDGKPKDYSPYFRADRKPDIYAVATLLNSPIADWVDHPEYQGTSFAAMAVAADAAVIWATYRKLTGQQVAQIIRDTGTPIAPANPRRRSNQPKRVNLDAALRDVHELMIKDILESGPAGFTRIAAQSGLPIATAAAALDRLVKGAVVERQARSDQDVYVYLDSIAARYAALLSAGDAAQKRDQTADTIYADARALSARLRWSAANTAEMWASPDRGMRILALANMRENDAARQVDLLRDALARPALPDERRYSAEIIQLMGVSVEPGPSDAGGPQPS